MIDNQSRSFLGVILGQEFDSKIIPFGAKNFIENSTIFLVLLSFYVFPIDSQSNYQTFFIVFLVLGFFSNFLLYFVKYNKT